MTPLSRAMSVSPRAGGAGQRSPRSVASCAVRARRRQGAGRSGQTWSSLALVDVEAPPVAGAGPLDRMILHRRRSLREDIAVPPSPPGIRATPLARLVVARLLSSHSARYVGFLSIVHAGTPRAVPSMFPQVSQEIFLSSTLNGRNVRPIWRKAGRIAQADLDAPWPLPPARFRLRRRSARGCAAIAPGR
jgi:hypothetical protein